MSGRAAVVAGLILLALVAVVVGAAMWRSCGTYETEHDDYRDPSRPPDDIPLVDDRIEDKKATFDSTLVHPVKIEGWEVNLSEAIFRLDCPAVLDAEMLDLRASYRDAIRLAKEREWELLPSVNLIDGKAKQFDDGLYAALDLAHYEGVQAALRSHVDLVTAILARLPDTSPARPFLAAALVIAGGKSDDPAVKRWLEEFEADRPRSTVGGFYEWSPELGRVFRFLRFLAHKFGTRDAVSVDLAQAIRSDEALLLSYQELIDFFSKLTNPPKCLPLDRLGESGDFAAFLPPSTSAHAVLFERLFPRGIPPNANVMRELIVWIRSGEVDLRPTEKSGWFDYQVYALEVLVLPERGEENRKLVLTAAYKRRMLEAFKALMTKRVETHRRQLEMAKCESKPPDSVSPRFRVEPSATYYLRTARAYAFLETFLTAAVGAEKLAALHGLRKEGPRRLSLAAELAEMKERFYGFYVLACEDVGMRPKFLEGETVDASACSKSAVEWLNTIEDDADLAADTRVAVPVAQTPGGLQVWGTLGVRLAPLDVSYARLPRIRRSGSTEWEPPSSRVDSTRYVIAVDEFAEFAIPTDRPPTREAFRAICDRERTKDRILMQLRKR